MQWRWLQFSLRSLIIGFFLLSIVCGLVAWWINGVRDRGEAQLWLVNQSDPARPASPGEDYRQRLTAGYAPESKTTYFTQFVRKWVHPEYHRRLDYLTLGSDHTDHEHLKRVGRLFDVEHLIIRGEIAAKDLKFVFAAPGLKKLNLDCKVTEVAENSQWTIVQQARQLEWFELGADRDLPDALVREVSNLPTLKKIRMSCESPQSLETLCRTSSATEALFVGSEGKWVLSYLVRETKKKGSDDPTKAPSKAVFDELAKREKLDRLLLCYIELNDPASIREFCKHSKITRLYGPHWFVSPECLAELANLQKLTSLSLGQASLAPEQVQILKSMENLKELNIGKTTRPELFQELQNALPNCKIGKM